MKRLILYCIIVASMEAAATVYVEPDTIYASVGDTFNIDIIASGTFNDLWGYEYYLGYNTEPLNAIAFVSYPPFTLYWPSFINDEDGYVAVAASEPLGTQSGPNNYARLTKITFVVDIEGNSILDPADPRWPGYPLLSDVHGGDIPVDGVAVGYFFSLPSGIAQIEKKTFPEFLFVPSFFKDNIQIKFTESSNISLKISLYSSYGILVFEEVYPYTPLCLTLDDEKITELASGIYFLSVLSGQGNIKGTIKLIKP